MRMYNPPHPGQFIREVYLEPLGVSHRAVAAKLRVSASTFTRLVNGSYPHPSPPYPSRGNAPGRIPQPNGIDPTRLAQAIHVPYPRVNELVNQKRGVTPGTALRLAKFFGMSPDFWLNLQLRWDLYHAQQKEAGQLEHIRLYQHA